MIRFFHSAVRNRLRRGFVKPSFYETARYTQWNMMEFAKRLEQRVRETRCASVVGLDPDFALMPEWFRKQFKTPCAEALEQFCLLVTDAVQDLVPMVKPQSAYFEVFGSAGIAALERVVHYCKDRGLLVLLDVKRGDI